MQKPGVKAAIALLITASGCAEPSSPPPSSEGGAVFDVVVRVVDGRVLAGQSVYRPGVPDLFCVRSATLSCKGSVLNSTESIEEISFFFDCDDGTDGIAFIQREIADGRITPTGGVVRKKNAIWASIEIAMQRRTVAGEEFGDLEVCGRG